MYFEALNLYSCINCRGKHFSLNNCVDCKSGKNLSLYYCINWERFRKVSLLDSSVMKGNICICCSTYLLPPCVLDDVGEKVLVMV